MGLGDAPHNACADNGLCSGDTLHKAFRLELDAYWVIVAVVIAVAVSCAWIGFMAVSFAHKGTKISYIGIANAFNVLLAAILISDFVNNQ